MVFTCYPTVGRTKESTSGKESMFRTLVLFSATASLLMNSVSHASQFTELKKLTASDAAAADFFGFSVAISDDTAIIGAYRNDVGGLDSGRDHQPFVGGLYWRN